MVTDTSGVWRSLENVTVKLLAAHQLLNCPSTTTMKSQAETETVTKHRLLFICLPNVKLHFPARSSQDLLILEAVLQEPPTCHKRHDSDSYKKEKEISRLDHVSWAKPRSKHPRARGVERWLGGFKL